ncbi:MAG: flavin reductase family protein [Deltaproteobacteria bacterium]|nr:flavin reductase family protein [Deltaproteobacteria bacterium]
MKQSLGPITLLYPLPAFLVGSYDAAGKANIMTAAWGGICCSEPPLLAVSIRKGRWTYDAVMARGAFTINIPSVSLVAQVDFAGIASGKKTDKFKELNLTAVRSDLVDAPYVGECPVVVEARLHSSQDLGSHVQFIGKIEDVKVDRECLDEDGKPVLFQINPLLYDAGTRQYHHIGAPMGKAFADGKIFWRKTEE